MPNLLFGSEVYGGGEKGVHAIFRNYLLPHTREWRFATLETFVARASAHWTVLVRRQTAHLVVHSERKRAVNRLLPRGSPSRHSAQLAHESTVELSHSSSHGANRHSCHAEKSISILREARRYVAPACCGSRSTLSSSGVSSLLCRCRSASAVRLPRRQRRRNERRDLRAGLHRTFESTYSAAPDRLAALRKPAMSHGTPLHLGTFLPTPVQ